MLRPQAAELFIYCKKRQDVLYLKRWRKGENLPLYWVKGRGHNSNTDRPDEINGEIEKFTDNLL